VRSRGTIEVVETGSCPTSFVPAANFLTFEFCFGKKLMPCAPSPTQLDIAMIIWHYPVAKKQQENTKQPKENLLARILCSRGLDDISAFLLSFFGSELRKILIAPHLMQK